MHYSDFFNEPLAQRGNYIRDMPHASFLVVSNNVREISLHFHKLVDQFIDRLQITILKNIQSSSMLSSK